MVTKGPDGLGRNRLELAHVDRLLQARRFARLEAAGADLQRRGRARRDGGAQRLVQRPGGPPGRPGRAEVIFWSDLLEIGSWAKAKEAGKLRVEGKDYVVVDGDVLEIRFNV